MKFAAVQLSSQADAQANLSAARREVERAKLAGAEVVLLPEGFAFLGPEADKRKIAESLSLDPPGDGPIAGQVRAWSREFDLCVIAGGLAESSDDPDRPYNTSVAYLAGSLVARYRKVHLFDVDLADGTQLSESSATTAGDGVATFDFGSVRVGLATCYDVRFPELFAEERKLGCHVIAMGAAFTRTTGQAHWHVLIRARAIETQCYVVAAAQYGEHPRGRRTFGHSMIVDPWGETLAELKDGQGVVVADIDLERIASVRRQMPLEKHRRLR